MGSLADRKTREAYVMNVRGSNHQTAVITDMTTPITRTMTLIVRRAADRSIVFRCCGEGDVESFSAGGPDR
jgi:hypothetical protein